MDSAATVLLDSVLQAKRLTFSFLWYTRRFILRSDRTLNRYDGEQLRHSATITSTTSVAKVGEAELTITFLQSNYRYHIRAESCLERDRWASTLADTISTAPVEHRRPMVALGQSREAMHLPHAQSSVGGAAALGSREGRRKERPRQSLSSHPACEFFGCDGDLIAELLACPWDLYCRSLRCSVQRLQVKFCCHAPSQAHTKQCDIYGIDISLKQRTALTTTAVLRELLVLRLMYFRGACRVRYPLHHAKCILSRRHFLGRKKNQAQCLFRKGKLLFTLGFMSDTGQGVTLDVAQAMRWYQLAAAQGNANAYVCIGSMFENGRGVVQDMVEAVQLYSFAAALGDAIAQYNLGYMFAKGRGVGQNMTEAVRCYKLSAANGHEDAKRALKLLRLHD
jgi:hypothetical protein